MWAKSAYSWNLVAEGHQIGPEDKYTWEVAPAAGLVSRIVQHDSEEFIEEKSRFSIHLNPVAKQMTISKENGFSYEITDLSVRMILRDNI